MKHIAYLIIPLLLISIYGGCSSECANCGPPLPIDCVSEGFAESECLGEDISNACFGFFCRTVPEVSVPIAIYHCTFIDCESMECEDILYTDLNHDDVNGITATVIDDGVDLGNVSCGFFQN